MQLPSFSLCISQITGEYSVPMVQVSDRLASRESQGTEEAKLDN